jgi:predicted O-methyltransferase YrrM
MTPTTRAELATLIPSGGLVIELGVAAGEFAAEMLAANPSITYVGIDRWSDHHDEAEMNAAKARLWPWRDRVGLVRATFADHLPLLPDDFADMIYIDGYAHTGQEGGQTLRDWWPKLKAGGIFAGHDYCRKYPQTIAAVDAFVAENGLALNVIKEKPHSSWWIRKSELSAK